MRIGDVIPFETIHPYYIQDEFTFALDDLEASGPVEGWNRTAIPVVTLIDGRGYACPPKNLLGEADFTYHVCVDGESLVWSWPAERWMIVGDDI